MSNRALRLALALFLVGVVLVIGYRAYDGEEAQAAAPPTIAQAKPIGPADYQSYLTTLDTGVEGALERRDFAPDEWLRQASYAAALGSRARLSGNYRDWATADSALELALEQAPPGTGPIIGGAAHHLGLHRLDKAEALLRNVEHFAVRPDISDRAEVEAMRGDIAFYRGDYDEAERRYVDAYKIQRNPGTLVRLSAYARAKGDLDRAERLLREAGGAAERPTRLMLSKLYLQLADLEYGRGNWSEARDHIESANAIFPGYWLAQSYRAQLYALEGKGGAAIDAFEILAKAHPQPELFQILATLYAEQGRDEEADRLVSRARAIWDERLATLPEAAIGHAIEHHIKHGDPAKALELAKRDYASRPYGGTAKMLAEAYLINDRPAAAAKLLREMESSGWRSTEMYLFLADAEEMQGNPKIAESLRDKAVAMDARALDPAREYLWFGHS